MSTPALQDSQQWHLSIVRLFLKPNSDPNPDPGPPSRPRSAVVGSEVMNWPKEEVKSLSKVPSPSPTVTSQPRRRPCFKPYVLAPRPPWTRSSYKDSGRAKLASPTVIEISSDNDDNDEKDPRFKLNEDFKADPLPGLNSTLNHPNRNRNSNSKSNSKPKPAASGHIKNEELSSPQIRSTFKQRVTTTRTMTRNLPPVPTTIMGPRSIRHEQSVSPAASAPTSPDPPLSISISQTRPNNTRAHQRAKSSRPQRAHPQQPHPQRAVRPQLEHARAQQTQPQTVLQFLTDHCQPPLVHLYPAFCAYGCSDIQFLRLIAGWDDKWLGEMVDGVAKHYEEMFNAVSKRAEKAGLVVNGRRGEEEGRGGGGRRKMTMMEKMVLKYYIRQLAPNGLVL